LRGIAERLYMAGQNEQVNQAQNNQQNPQIQIKITDEVLKGNYANFLQVMHTPEEFVLDFMNIFPPNGIATSRVIISPAHMKRIVAALEDNMKRYEAAHGAVKAAAEPTHKIGFEA
jgi:hypothetical protein